MSAMVARNRTKNKYFLAAYNKADDMEPLNDIRERVIWVINEAVGTAHKYPYLEKRTGISARKWKNMCNRVQQPSIEMLAALAREFRPLYLEWMVHGQVLSSQQINPEEEKLDDGSYAHPLLKGGIRALNDMPKEGAVEELTESFFRPLATKRARRKQ